MDLKGTKALTFDIGGTVFDWHSTIRDEIARQAQDRNVRVNAAQFANDWRKRMFELLFQVRRGQLPWMNADELHRRALDEILPSHLALQLTAAERDALNRVWHRLHAWPDAPAAIAELRKRYTVVVLTVLSWSIAVDCSKAASICWDGILSCEFLGHYKTDREAYLAGVRLLGVEPEEAIMVAAHPVDLAGAAAAGLRTAYVARPDEPAIGPPETPAQVDFDIRAQDFADLTRQLMA